MHFFPKKLLFLPLLFLVPAKIYSQSWYAEADRAYVNGNFDSAYHLNQKAIDVFNSKQSYDSLVYAYLQKTNILWDLEGIQVALKMIDSTLYLSEKYQTSALSAIAALNKKGQLLVHATYFMKAKETFEEAEKLLQNSNTNSALAAQLYTNISWLYLNLRQLPEAFDYALKSLEIQKQIYGENDRKLMGVYQSLGLIANDLANYEDAEFYSQKLYEIASENLEPDHPTMALVYNQFALIYESRFEYSEALMYAGKMAQVSKSTYEKTGNPQFLAISYNNIGNLYYQIYEYSLAEPYFEKALLLHQENYGLDDIGIIQSLAHLAGAKKFLGKIDEADSLFQLAYSKQQILEKENVPGLANLESQIGDLYTSLDQPQEALKWYKKSLLHFEQSNVADNYLVAEAKTSMANALVNLNQFEKAVDFHQQSLQTNRKLYPDSEIVISGKLNNLSYTYLKKGDLNRALSYSDSTFLELLEDIDFNTPHWVLRLPPHIRVADFIKNRLEILKEINASNQNREGLAEIINISKNYSSNFERSIIGLRTQSSLVDLARINRRILQIAMDACWDLAQTHGEKQRLEEAFLLSELQKGVLLRLASNSMMIYSKANDDDAVLRKDKKYRDHIQKLNAAYLNSTGANDSILNLLSNSLEDYGRFKDSISRSDYALWNKKYSLKPLRISEIRDSLLEKNEVLIEFTVSENSIYTFMLSDTDFKVLKSDRHSIQASIGNFQSLSRLSLEEFKTSSFQIFEQLISPIYPLIKDRNLILIPDKELFSINFETLITDKKGLSFSELNYMIKNNEFTYLLSASTSPKLYDRPNIDLKGNGLFMAPGFTEEMKNQIKSNLIDQTESEPIQLSLVRQPFSIRTAKLASDHLGGTLLLENQALESTFNKEAGHYNILHFATHGEAQNTFPMLSKLFFAFPDPLDSSQNDGILHAYEIYGLQLGADLAVLSACNSGMGKFQEGEGVISLAHSFLHAGCSSVMMSLWEIDEKTNSEILIGFYEMLSKGKSKSSSLREAKLEFLESVPDELAHPFYWAGLGIIGDNSAIDTTVKRSTMAWFFIFIVALIGFGVLLKKRMGT